MLIQRKNLVERITDDRVALAFRTACVPPVPLMSTNAVETQDKIWMAHSGHSMKSEIIIWTMTGNQIFPQLESQLWDYMRASGNGPKVETFRYFS